MKVLPLLLPVACLLVSCAAPRPHALANAGESESTGDLSLARVPVLKFGQDWGLPSITNYPDGGYRLRYRQGTTLNFVMIEGRSVAKPAPATPPQWGEESEGENGFPTQIMHSQQWRTATILGKPVKWYQSSGGSGADFPGYKTVAFSATAPNGRAGCYEITIFSDTEAKAAAWMKKVKW